MKYFDDITLVGGSIHNAIIENLNQDPTFVDTDAGRLYFNSSSDTLRLNNGTEYIDVTLPTNFSALITTLGNNWITADFGFNPTPFNSLNNVSGLTANSTLFDVISALDTAISSSDGNALTSLSDVVETTELTTGDLVFYNGANFTFASVDDIIENYGQIKIGSLADVSAATPTDGAVLVYSAGTQTYNAVNPFYITQDLQNTTNHTINHTLGTTFCAVTVINASNGQIINNATITLASENVVSIALVSAAPVIVILMAPPSFNNALT
jgi:hypothetical protein